MALSEQHSGVSAADVKRRRDLAQQLLYGKSKPITHPLEGAADLANALVGGLAMRRADREEKEGRASANSILARALGGDDDTTSPAQLQSSGSSQPAIDPANPVATAWQGAQQPGNDSLAQALIGKAKGAGFESPQAMNPMAGKFGPGQNVDAPFVTSGLQDRGLAPHIAEGFAMNLRDESNFNPAANEANPAVPGSRGGFGLAQWTGDRRTGLEDFASQRNVDASNPNMQLDYLANELKGPEATAMQNISATQNPNYAAASIAKYFLRPAPQNLQARISDYQDRAPSNQVAQDGGDMAALPGAEPAQNFQTPGQPTRQEDIAALLSNDFIDPQIKSLLLKRLLPEESSPVEVNGRLVNPQTGQVIADFSDAKAPKTAEINGETVEWTGEGWRPVKVPGMGPSKPELARQSQLNQADIVTTDIGRALNTITNSTLPTTGAIGSTLSNIGGTGASDLSATLDTVKGNIGFDKLQAMRAASPTGGALGNVSDQENKTLQATMGALAQSQSRAQLEYNLKRLENEYNDIIHGKGNGPERHALSDPYAGAQKKKTSTGVEWSIEP